MSSLKDHAIGGERKDALLLVDWWIGGYYNRSYNFVIWIFSMFYLSNSPAKAWFLNAKEKKYALKRAQDNQQGFGNHHFKNEQFIEALTDITSWLFFIYSLSYAIPNGGFSNFD